MGRVNEVSAVVLGHLLWLCRERDSVRDVDPNDDSALTGSRVARYKALSEAISNLVGGLRATGLGPVLDYVWRDGLVRVPERGPDDCRCAAWCECECGCGLFGTGEVLTRSPFDVNNPEGTL